MVNKKTNKKNSMRCLFMFSVIKVNYANLCYGELKVKLALTCTGLNDKTSKLNSF